MELYNHSSHLLFTDSSFSLTSKLSKIMWLCDPLASNKSQVFKWPQGHYTSLKFPLALHANNKFNQFNTFFFWDVSLRQSWVSNCLEDWGTYLEQKGHLNVITLILMGAHHFRIASDSRGLIVACGGISLTDVQLQKPVMSFALFIIICFQFLFCHYFVWKSFIFSDGLMKKEVTYRVTETHQKVSG